MIPAGTFDIEYDETRKQYLVKEIIEGSSSYLDDLDCVLEFIRDHTWEPAQEAE